MRIDSELGGATAFDYVERVNRAIDAIVGGLDQPLRLADLAHVAGFSSFHFHRVFRSLVGETLNQFVKRVRLERALAIMSHDPSRSLTDTALDCGFSSSSDFSRSFKQRYGVAPSAFDLDAFRAENRARLADLVQSSAPHLRVQRLPAGENPDGFEVELRTLPARTVAYTRVSDPYVEGRVTGAAERLVSWAEATGRADGQWLGYMWDDPEVVALEDCRYDVGVVVDDVEPHGEIGRFDFPAMRVAQVEVRGGIDLEMRALDWLWGTWLPRSRHVPADAPAFESWIGRPFAHGTEHFELHLQLPVRRAK